MFSETLAISVEIRAKDEDALVDNCISGITIEDLQ